MPCCPRPCRTPLGQAARAGPDEPAALAGAGKRADHGRSRRGRSHLSAWIGLLAPAKTPRPIIDQLNRAVRAAMDADFKAKLAESGIEVAPGTPEELQRTISADIKLHAELVKAAGLTPQ